MLSREDLEGIEAYEYYCELKFTSKVNGERLLYTDFGTKEDRDPTILDPKKDDMKVYPGCGEMCFIPFSNINTKALEKYNITEEEYRMIQKKLSCLTFGKCTFCC